MKSITVRSLRDPLAPLALRAVPRFFQAIQRPWGAAMSFSLDVNSEVLSNLRLFRIAPAQKPPSRRELQSRIGEPTP